MTSEGTHINCKHVEDDGSDDFVCTSKDIRKSVTIDFEDARRIFDLAVNADSACSGYMESDDVASMRKLAVALGVDPAVCTGSEFVAKYPHTFEPESERAAFDRVRSIVVVKRPDSWHASNITVTRPETDGEILERFDGCGQIRPMCVAGGYFAKCGRDASDSIHNV